MKSPEKDSQIPEHVNQKQNIPSVYSPTASCACWVWDSLVLNRQDGSSSGTVHTQAEAMSRKKKKTRFF